MQRHLISIIVKLFLIQSTVIPVLSVSIFGQDSQINSKIPTLIQQPAGWDVKLKCGIWSNHTDFMALSEVYWDFKHCGEGYHQISCRKNINNDQLTIWKRIACNESELCGATFKINNPTERESGLYRCSIQPYKPDDKTTLQIQVVKTFQLNVINFTVAAPELIDDLPANATATVDSQVVLQCKVHSKVQPSIKWFRRQDINKDSFNNKNNNYDHIIDDENYHTRIIQYFENTYELLESAGEKIQSDDTYLSKLILNNVSERDTGFYVCVGINYRGFKIREAYVNVLSVNDNDESRSDGITEFYVLFFIPIGLALIPALLWCIYLLFKYLENRKEMIKHRRKSADTVHTDYIEIRHNRNNVNQFVN